MDTQSPDHGPFWWFGPDSAAELAHRLTTALAAGTFERLEVRIGASEHRPMTFRVVERGDGVKLAVKPDINDSWLCPPICPGGGG